MNRRAQLSLGQRNSGSRWDSRHRGDYGSRKKAIWQKCNSHIPPPVLFPHIGIANVVASFNSCCRIFSAGFIWWSCAKVFFAFHIQLVSTWFWLKALVRNLGSQGHFFFFLRPRLLKKVRKKPTGQNQMHGHCARVYRIQAKRTGFRSLIVGDLNFCQQARVLKQFLDAERLLHRPQCLGQPTHRSLSLQCHLQRRAL